MFWKHNFDKMMPFSESFLLSVIKNNIISVHTNLD